MKFYIYDLETMFNCFLFTGKFEDGQSYCFEMSPRANHRGELIQHLNYLKTEDAVMVGYNNLGFDYHIVHDLLNNPYVFDHARAYAVAQNIIKTQGFGENRFVIHQKERYLRQLDLLKLNHFDNVAKTTSLKSLQFAMRSESVEDLPFPFDTDLTFEQMDLMRSYNLHDVTETEKFLKICKPIIKIRQDLIDTGAMYGDVLNYSDVKIGEKFLVDKIGRAKCFAGNKPRQTQRQSVEYKSVMLPKIYFRTEPFQAVHEWFKQQTIWIYGESRPKLSALLADLQFEFGAGGLHASVEKQKFVSDDRYIIKDVDVSGMYVAVGVANGFAPEHLGADFVLAYRQIQADRAQHAKGTSMNAVLKLAGNGAYGKSNNQYSPLYDPKYTFTVTVNGQLQLLQLAEVLSLVPGVRLIQANTDGITALVPREHEALFDMWCRAWERETNLKLEDVEYSHMWIRDVNNYVARKVNGEIKAKGAYWYPRKLKDYEGAWNKDYSNMAAQKGIEQVLLYGLPPEQAIRLMTDKFDFMLRYKAVGDAKVFIGDVPQQKTTRYYVSTAGAPMFKLASPKGVIGQFKRCSKITDEFFNRVMGEIPAGAWDKRIHTKNKSTYQITRTSIENGRRVKACNRASDFNWTDVDFDYYADEIRKLMI